MLSKLKEIITQYKEVHQYSNELDLVLCEKTFQQFINESTEEVNNSNLQIQNENNKLEYCETLRISGSDTLNSNYLIDKNNLFTNDYLEKNNITIKEFTDQLRTYPKNKLDSLESLLIIHKIELE